MRVVSWALRYGAKVGPDGAHPLEKGHYPNAGWLSLDDGHQYTRLSLTARDFKRGGTCRRRLLLDDGK